MGYLRVLLFHNCMGYINFINHRICCQLYTEEGSQLDYTVNTLRARALANGQISNVEMTFRVDSIAQ